jgi:hypothetical protein
VFEQVVITITVLLLNTAIWVVLYTDYVKWEKLLLFATSYFLLFLELGTLLKWLSTEDKISIWIPVSENSGPKNEYRETYQRLLSNYNFVWKSIIPKVVILLITYFQLLIIWHN